MLPKSEKLCFDMLTAIDEIQDFLAESSQESFIQSRLQQVAIARELEIIGEALNRLERADTSLFDQIKYLSLSLLNSQLLTAEGRTGIQLLH